MATPLRTASELDARLLQDRSAWADTAEQLRHRLRRDLNPKLQMQQAAARRPWPFVAAALLAGLLAGRGLRRLWR